MFSALRMRFGGGRPTAHPIVTAGSLWPTVAGRPLLSTRRPSLAEWRGRLGSTGNSVLLVTPRAARRRSACTEEPRGHRHLFRPTPLLREGALRNPPQER